METTPRSYKKYTIETKLKVIKLYKKGVTINDISKKLKITISVVIGWVNRYSSNGTAGLQGRKPNRVSGEQKIAIMRDVTENLLTCVEASVKYNVSRGTISYWKQKVLAGGFEALDDNLRRKTTRSTSASYYDQATLAEIKRLQQEFLRLKLEVVRLMQNA